MTFSKNFSNIRQKITRFNCPFNEIGSNIGDILSKKVIYDKRVILDINYFSFNVVFLRKSFSGSHFLC